MKISTFLILIISFFNFSCVGTLQDSAQQFSGVSDFLQKPLVFPGVYSVVPISDTKVEIFFYPASGGSGKYTYDIILSNSDFPVSIPSDILQPDYRGILKYTMAGLKRLTTYQVKVEVRDSETEVQSNSQIIKSATTFDNEVADFTGISSAFNMPGQDGKDSIKIRWTPAKTSGGLTRKDWDPKAYEVTVVDSARLTPNDMDVGYTSNQGRWVYSFNHSDTMNEYIVRGLPSESKFYIRIRAIHEASIDDVYNPRKKGEQNTTYVTISTLSSKLSDIQFQPESFALSLTPGSQGLSSINSSWAGTKGVFDHYRVYYSVQGGGVATGIFPDLCMGPLIAPVGETTFCKKSDFNTSSTPITGLLPYNTYEVVLVLCATTQCSINERIISPMRTIKTDPSSPSFNGVREISQAQTLDDVGVLFVKYNPPNFSAGYFDGLILKMRRTTDGSDAEVEINLNSNPIYHDSYNFLSENQIIVRGVNYLSQEPYCFTIYPYKRDSDGVTIRENPNGIWKCLQPKAESPTALQFVGLSEGVTESSRVTLSWNTPLSGMYNYYEIFWRKQSGGNFSWGDAISQAGNTFDNTNYERILIPSGINTITLDGFANGQYTFGVLTYFNYVTNDGSVVLRSETNGSLKVCTFDDTSPANLTCL